MVESWYFIIRQPDCTNHCRYIPQSWLTYIQWITCWCWFDHHPTNPHRSERWGERCVIYTGRKGWDTTPMVFHLSLETFHEATFEWGACFHESNIKREFVDILPFSPSPNNHKRQKKLGTNSIRDIPLGRSRGPHVTRLVFESSLYVVNNKSWTFSKWMKFYPSNKNIPKDKSY